MTDNRTPVSVTHVGKFKVTIFDQEAYDRSLVEYPDENVSAKRKENFKTVSKADFTKQKPAARWNWITKLDKPLAG